MRAVIHLLAWGSLVFLITACGGGGASGGGATSLSSISGPVVGYPFDSSANLQGFAILDGALLATGTLTPTNSGASFTADLTPLSLVPTSAYANPLMCNNMIVSPATALITGVFILGAVDSGGVFGLLANTTVASGNPVTTDDKFYVYLLADRQATIRGTCMEDGISATFLLDLKRGWNRAEVAFTLIDGFGLPIAQTWRVTESNANSTWVFTELATFSGAVQPNRFVLEIERTLQALFRSR